jgi:monooxygenase
MSDEHVDVLIVGAGISGVGAHVTMLQRSPSYVISLPAVDPIAGLLGRALPTRLAYPIVRWKSV